MTHSKSSRKATRKSLSGYFMIELMLGLVIVGTLLAFSAGLVKTSDARAAGSSSGQQLTDFSAQVSRFYKANRTVIDGAMADGTAASQWCMIGLAADGTGGIQTNSITTHTCAFDASLMNAKAMFDPNTSTGTSESSYVAIFRQLYGTSAVPVATGASEAIFVLTPKSGALTGVVVTANMTDELITARATMGGIGGMVPVGDFGGCVAKRSASTYQVCGSSWKINLADYIDSPQLTAFSAALPN